jgi:hypothetical protein
MIMGKKSTERLMTLPELAEMLGVPIETLYGWRHRGARDRCPLQGALPRCAGKPHSEQTAPSTRNAEKRRSSSKSATDYGAIPVAVRSDSRSGPPIGSTPGTTSG